MKIRPFILLILTALTGLLVSTAPLEAQVVSNDANFTPAVLVNPVEAGVGAVPPWMSVASAFAIALHC